MRFHRAAAVAAGLALAGVPLQARAASTAKRPACTGNPTDVRRIDLGPTYGLYAAPKQRPTGLVVFDHGYGHNAEDWHDIVVSTAQRKGVIAVAVDYVPAEGRAAGGWWVSEGSAATIAAAKAFDGACPTLQTNVVYGVSMGGNTSGLAAASHATRA